MHSWKNHLLWAALPFGMLVFVIGSISALNWDYESKLIFLDHHASDWTGEHLGPLDLMVAVGMTVAAGTILFLVRALSPKARGPWFMVPLTIVTLFLTFPSLFIAILGPAAITMMDQVRQTPK